MHNFAVNSALTLLNFAFLGVDITQFEFSLALVLHNFEFSKRIFRSDVTVQFIK